jgi:hypothetical protein
MAISSKPILDRVCQPCESGSGVIFTRRCQVRRLQAGVVSVSMGLFSKSVNLWSQMRHHRKKTDQSNCRIRVKMGGQPEAVSAGTSLFLREVKS